MDAISVRVNLERGEIAFGTRSVRLEPVGSLRYQITPGVTVRALTFDERCAVVEDAIASRDPVKTLVALLRAKAIEGDGGILGDAVALALAGGAEHAPGFDECVRTAARHEDWESSSIGAAPALHVDRTLARSEEPPEDDGWMRFVFADHSSDDIDRWCIEMADRLLERGVASPLSCRLAELPASQDLRDLHSAPGSQVALPSETGLSPSIAGELPSRSATQPPREHASDQSDRRETSSGETAPLAATPKPNLSLGNRAVALVRRSTVASEAASAPALDPTPRARVLSASGEATPRLVRVAANARVQVMSAIQNTPQRTSQPSPQVGSLGPEAAHVPDGRTTLPGEARGPDSRLLSAFQSSLESSGSMRARPLLPQGTHEPVDWVENIARALADECDLRGIDA